MPTMLKKARPLTILWIATPRRAHPIDHLCQRWAANTTGALIQGGQQINQDDVDLLKAYIAEPVTTELSCIGPFDPQAQD